MALNTAMGWRRHERRRPVRRQSVLETEDLAASGRDSAGRPTAATRSNGSTPRSADCPRTYAALVLLYPDDLGYLQMAEVLDVSETNVGLNLNLGEKGPGRSR